jgi:6-phosphogluconolactonase
MNQQYKLQVFEDGNQLTEAIADFIVRIAKTSVRERDKFVISLSGGHTPEHLYALLAKAPYKEQIDWSKVIVYWGDERCVPADDKDNNARMARTQLLDHVPIPPANVNAVPVELQPAEAATAYEQTIKEFFNGAAPIFDLILLGLGDNGHTASLFPGTEVVFEKERLVKEVYVDEQKMFRITMTAPLINQARNIAFLLEGDGKAQILKKILTEDHAPEEYPAELIQPVNGTLYWFADKKAAALVND